MTRSVVCLHGLRRTPADWDGVQAGLGAYGTVRTPDLLPRPADALRTAGAGVAADDIVVGHSMGGVIALRLADALPLRALVLTGCFFPPARNGRSVAAMIGDYAAHRVAFVRAIAGGEAAEERSAGSARALGLLIRQAVGRGADPDITIPVLVVHARDDHHVPIDFALAAVASHSGWVARVLDTGGHDVHVRRPEAWLDAVKPWLDRNDQAMTASS